MMRCRLTMTMLASVLGLISSSALADDAHWNNGAGGSFHDPNNWDWDGGDPRVPGPDDRALFTLGGTFTVDFADDAATAWLGCLGGWRLHARPGRFHILSAQSVIHATKCQCCQPDSSKRDA